MWYSITNGAAVSTPSVAVYPDRIRENIRRMTDLVDPSRLCPHVKTHKTLEVSGLYVHAGVDRFKCATLAEIEMTAMSEAAYALLAVQPVGPNIERLMQLRRAFPQVQVAVIADNAQTVMLLDAAASKHEVRQEVLVDIDNGMHRTGIAPNDDAADLFRQIHHADNLIAGGFHVYDGHIHDSDLSTRTRHVEAAMAPVLELKKSLDASGYPVGKLLTGGTPSFPVHAQHQDRICCPGTTVFWDAGYDSSFPDLDFLPAAVLLTRVISKLSESTYCTDLGYKAIAAEMSHPRAHFLNADVVREVGHSEEHLVIEVKDGNRLEVGDLLYAIPRHICPTVARHSELLVVEDGSVEQRWEITARDRRITI